MEERVFIREADARAVSLLERAGELRCHRTYLVGELLSCSPTGLELFFGLGLFGVQACSLMSLNVRAGIFDSGAIIFWVGGAWTISAVAR